MTKRRDRNRTARRRRRVYRFYWSYAEEHAVARIIAARILQTAQTEREETHRTLHAPMPRMHDTGRLETLTKGTTP